MFSSVGNVIETAEAGTIMLRKQIVTTRFASTAHVQNVGES